MLLKKKEKKSEWWESKWRCIIMDTTFLKMNDTKNNNEQVRRIALASSPSAKWEKRYIKRRYWQVLSIGMRKVA